MFYAVLLRYNIIGMVIKINSNDLVMRHYDFIEIRIKYNDNTMVQHFVSRLDAQKQTNSSVIN